MSHLLLAYIWQILIGQLDISNVVLEILGAFSLSSIHASREDSRYLVYELFVRLKIVFDAQRSLFQDDPYLIHPELLLAAIDQVIRLRISTWVNTGSHPQGEEYRMRAFFAPVLLSGLRAFVLRQIVLHPEKKQLLKDKVVECLIKDEDTLEQDILGLCLEAIENIPVSDNSVGHLECLPRDSNHLPNWNTFKFKLPRSSIESFTTALRDVQANESKDAFFKAYDILGLLENAFIARCILEKGDGQAWTDIDEKIRQEILSKVYSAGQSEGIANYAVMLKDVLLHWCGEGCTCYNLASQALKTSDPAPQRHIDVELNKMLKKMLEFLRTISQRNSATESEHRQLFERLYKQIVAWRGEQDSAPNISDEDLEKLECVTYVVNCHELHAVSASRLATLNRNDSFRQKLRDQNHFIKFDAVIHCPRCSHYCYIQTARRITPLDEALTVFRAEELNAKRGSPKSLLSDTTHDSYPIILSRFSSDNKGSSSGSNISGTQVEIPKSSNNPRKSRSSSILKFPFRPPIEPNTNKGAKEKQSNTKRKSKFSATGELLVMWSQTEDSVLICDMSKLRIEPERSGPPILKSTRLDVPKVLFACAGTERIACVSDGSSNLTCKKLMIFNSNSLEEPKIMDLHDIINMHIWPYGAMSLNDRYFAAVFGSNLYIYDVESNPPELKCKSPIASIEPNTGSLALNFSMDSEYLVLAISAKPRLVVLHKLDIHRLDKGRQMWATPNEIGIPECSPLTSVLVMPKFHLTLLGVMANSTYNILHTTKIRENEEHWVTKNAWDDFYSLQGAALSPDGRHAVLMTKTHRFYILDAGNLGIKHAKRESVGKANRPPAHSKHDIATLSFSSDQTIRAFWSDARSYQFFQTNTNQPQKSFYYGPIQISEE